MLCLLARTSARLSACKSGKEIARNWRDRDVHVRHELSREGDETQSRDMETTTRVLKTISDLQNAVGSYLA